MNSNQEPKRALPAGGLKKFLEENPDPVGVKEKGLQEFTWDEIAKHNTKEDAWTVYQNKVYNITKYLPYHPGGVGILKSSFGKDCTATYNKFHAYVNVDTFWGPFQIGTVKN